MGREPAPCMMNSAMRVMVLAILLASSDESLL
jgi:hypothetical protein